MFARGFFRGPGLAAVLADLLHERAPSGHERSSGGASDGSPRRGTKFSPRSLATAFKGKRGWSGQELELEEEHVARNVDALRDYHSPTTTRRCLTCSATTFG